MKKSGGKIISVSSSSHYHTKIKWSDIQLSKHYNQLKAYKQTKLINILLAREFNRRSSDVKTYLADPGLVNTDIGSKSSDIFANFIWQHRKNHGRTIEYGAKTSIYIACNNILGDDIYFMAQKSKAPDKRSFNMVHAKKLWDYCESICGIA